MKTGFTYEFDVSDPSNTENFAFSQTSDGTHNSGVEYTSNVTCTGTAGTAGAKVEIFINDSTHRLASFIMVRPHQELAVPSQYATTI